MHAEVAVPALSAEQDVMSYHALLTHKCVRIGGGMNFMLHTSYVHNGLRRERRKLASVHSAIRCTAFRDSWQEVKDPASGRLYFW